MGIATPAGPDRKGKINASRLIITLVILVIMDVDRPRRGYIRVSQQRMVNLQDSTK